MADDGGRTIPIVALTATDLRCRIAAGSVSVADVVEATIAQIDLREPVVGAFQWFDPDFLRHQAVELDRMRRSGRPVGPLHGVPVAVKDIFDTARIPTENGARLDAGRVPGTDAAVVARLKRAGALIAGKSVTAELAFMGPGRTTNPVDMSRTPGGSSSGSAAAVAAHMVPLAVGTQTGGSVIRPAAYCGIVGFKPTFGAIARTGVLEQSRSLDTVGVFARTVADAALLADAIHGADPGDPQSEAGPPPDLTRIAGSKAPVAPTFAFLKPYGWDEADPATHAAFAELADRLGAQCFALDLPPAFDDAPVWREIINHAEMARSFYRYGTRPDLLAPQTREALERGNAISARDYLTALDWQRTYLAGLAEVFARCDAVLSPAAPGPAPEGLTSTGSSLFNALWSLTGVPVVTLPLLETDAGLPMGVQLAAGRHADGRLLRTANWLAEWAAGEEEP